MVFFFLNNETNLRVTTAFQAGTREDEAASWIGFGSIIQLLVIGILLHLLIEDVAHVSRPAVHVEMEASVEQRSCHLNEMS